MPPSRQKFITEEQFWSWIKETSPEPYDGESHVARVTELLSSKTLDEILGFDFWMDWFSSLCFNGNLWGAAYLLNGGCSDDGFMDWRWGLIFRGEQICKLGVRDPDGLAEHWDALQDVRLEEAGYAAGWAYQKKTGQDSQHWYSLLHTFKDPHPETPDLTFLWEDDSDDDTWRRLYPRLWFRVTLENVMYERSRQTEE